MEGIDFGGRTDRQCTSKLNSSHGKRQERRQTERGRAQGGVAKVFVRLGLENARKATRVVMS